MPRASFTASRALMGVFYFTQFNTEITDFNLMVNAAQKLQVTIWYPAPQITCLIQALTAGGIILVIKWISDELLGTEVRYTFSTHRKQEPLMAQMQQLWGDTIGPLNKKS
jgi:hypothetical protein